MWLVDLLWPRLFQPAMCLLLPCAPRTAHIHSKFNQWICIGFLLVNQYFPLVERVVSMYCMVCVSIIICVSLICIKHCDMHADTRYIRVQCVALQHLRGSVRSPRPVPLLPRNLVTGAISSIFYFRHYLTRCPIICTVNRKPDGRPKVGPSEWKRREEREKKPNELRTEITHTHSKCTHPSIIFCSQVHRWHTMNSYLCHPKVMRFGRPDGVRWSHTIHFRARARPLWAHYVLIKSYLLFGM